MASEENEGLGGQQDTNHQHQHPNVLINENPFSSSIGSGIEFIQNYGWFILVGVIVLLYIRSKLTPKLHKFNQLMEDARAKKIDPVKAQSRLEAMEAARRRLQDKFDEQAAEYAEKAKIKEEEKRKQKIDDWDGHLQGKGYRSKFKPNEEESEKKSLKKPAKPLRQSDYNPLMGDGPSCSWRPSRRSGAGGGG